MKNILAIGGGRIYAGETKTIDSYATTFLPKDNRFLVVIPTASKDRADYIEAIKAAYEDLGVKTEAVREGDLGSDLFLDILGHAGGIYLGGGDVEYLLTKIGSTKIAQVLSNFSNSGKLVMGLSAGCGILFEKVLFMKGEKPIIVDGLGIIPGVVIPHYELSFVEKFQKEILRELNEGRKVYGLSNGSALHFTSQSEYRVVQEPDSQGAWQIFLESGSVRTRQIPVH